MIISLAIVSDHLHLYHHHDHQHSHQHIHCRLLRWESTGLGNDQPVGRRLTGGLQGGLLVIEVEVRMIMVVVAVVGRRHNFVGRHVTYGSGGEDVVDAVVMMVVIFALDMYCSDCLQK